MSQPLGVAAWRTTAALTVTAALAVCQSLIQWGVTNTFATLHSDPYHVRTMRERIEPVRERIPITGRVVFLSDVLFTDPNGEATFIAVQYALAPRILLRENSPAAPQSAYGIGIFSEPQDVQEIAARRGMTVEYDCGTVVLFRRLGARP